LSAFVRSYTSRLTFDLDKQKLAQLVKGHSKTDFKQFSQDLRASSPIPEQQQLTVPTRRKRRNSLMQLPPKTTVLLSSLLKPLSAQLQNEPVVDDVLSRTSDRVVIEPVPDRVAIDIDFGSFFDTSFADSKQPQPVTAPANTTIVSTGVSVLDFFDEYVLTPAVTPGLKGKSSKQMLRRKAEKEIVSSEQGYLATLNNLVKYYVDPLEAQPEKYGLDRADVNLLFGRIRNMQSFHTNVVSSMLHSSDNCVGVLMDYLPYFKMYAPYLNSFFKAQTLLSDRIQENSSLQTFLDSTAVEHVKGQSISSHLIAPIQRLMKYPILLDNLRGYLAKEVAEDSHDLQEVDEAIAAFSKLVGELNERKRVVENADLYSRIAQRLSGSSVPQLMAPHRQLLAHADASIAVALSDKAYHVTQKVACRLYIFNDLVLFLDQQDRQILLQVSEQNVVACDPLQGWTAQKRSYTTTATSSPVAVWDFIHEASDLVRVKAPESYFSGMIALLRKTVYTRFQRPDNGGYLYIHNGTAQAVLSRPPAFQPWTCKFDAKSDRVYFYNLETHAKCVECPAELAEDMNSVTAKLPQVLLTLQTPPDVAESKHAQDYKPFSRSDGLVKLVACYDAMEHFLFLTVVEVDGLPLSTTDYKCSVAVLPQMTAPEWTSVAASSTGRVSFDQMFTMAVPASEYNSAIVRIDVCNQATGSNRYISIPLARFPLLGKDAQVPHWYGLRLFDDAVVDPVVAEAASSNSSLPVEKFHPADGRIFIECDTPTAITLIKTIDSLVGKQDI
jgi:hypothetical protein